MLAKGPKCQGCPFWQDGQGGFTPDELVEGADVTVVAQGPGEREERGERLTHYEGSLQCYVPHPPAPLIGPAGDMLERDFLHLAGLERGKVSLTNVVRCRWQGRNDLPPLSTRLVRDAITHCQRAYWKPPTSTQLYVAMGEYAAWALTSEPVWKVGHKLNVLRGWLLPRREAWLHEGPAPIVPRVYYPQPGDVPVLVTTHPARLFREPWERPTVQADWRKVAQVREGAWPQRLPPVERRGPSQWPTVSGFDTEFHVSNVVQSTYEDLSPMSQALCDTWDVLSEVLR